APHVGTLCEYGEEGSLSFWGWSLSFRVWLVFTELGGFVFLGLVCLFGFGLSFRVWFVFSGLGGCHPHTRLARKPNTMSRILAPHRRSHRPPGLKSGGLALASAPRAMPWNFIRRAFRPEAFFMPVQVQFLSQAQRIRVVVGSVRASSSLGEGCTVPPGPRRQPWA